MRVLIFGASITQGFWDSEGGWVARLRKDYDKLEIENPKTDQPTIFNLGISGDSTKGLLARFEPETEARKFSNEEFVFVFSIGTNNAWEQRGAFNSSPEEYRDDLLKLIGKAKKYSQKILFVGLPPCDDTRTNPVSWTDKSYKSDRIWLFEQEMRKVCAEQNIPYVAVFEKMQSRLNAGDNLLHDGLHPNDEGHALMYELVKPELEKLLQQ